MSALPSSTQHDLHEERQCWDIKLNRMKKLYPDLYYRHMELAYQNMIDEIKAEHDKRNQELTLSILYVLLQMVNRHT